MAHACKHSTPEAEAEESGVGRQPRTHSEAMSQINKYRPQIRCNHKISPNEVLIILLAKMASFSDICPKKVVNITLAVRTLWFELCSKNEIQSFLWGRLGCVRGLHACVSV